VAHEKVRIEKWFKSKRGFFHVSIDIMSGSQISKGPEKSGLAKTPPGGKNDISSKAL
jgi:hypothetical protein